MGLVRTLQPLLTLDSLAKLEELHGIVVKSPSEVSNIELVLCKDDTIWAVCSQDKVIGKHIVLAGFGTGIWVPEGESEPGVDFKLDSDKTLVQLDESSFSSEAQGVTTLSLFKLLVRAEKEKGLTEHRLSFCSVERKQDSNLEGGSDGFEIKIKTPMKFKCMKDPRANQDQDRVTAKNFFPSA